MRILPILLVLAAVGGAGAWVLSAPSTLPGETFDGITGDAARGQAVFTAAGCASCHMAPDATGDAQLVLAGGQRFPSAFGTFVAPNISPDPDHGIGGWSVLDIANAIQRGVSPEGQHYYPALPYVAYSKMTAQDVADLHAYMMTLPADATPSQTHELSFPFTIRRSIGFWKLLFANDSYVLTGDLTAEEERGRYIAESLAHCGECHTPRNALGGLDRSRWLQGAPDPSGQGRVPGIDPATLTWSQDEIVEYLTSGFTPDYDSVGGHMAHVVENMSKLPDSDRQAVAAYLKRLAGPVPN